MQTAEIPGLQSITGDDSVNERNQAFKILSEPLGRISPQRHPGRLQDEDEHGKEMVTISLWGLTGKAMELGWI